jgi:hypothetical protein
MRPQGALRCAAGACVPAPEETFRGERPRAALPQPIIGRTGWHAPPGPEMPLETA